MLLFVLESLPPKYKSKVEKLYYDYRNDMLYTALAIVKDHSQAEDIVQLAFIRIIKHIGRISSIPADEVKGYVIYIVKNLSLDYLRKQKKDNTISYESIEFTVDDGRPLENIAMLDLDLNTVKEKLREMDEKYSLPLILKYTLEFSHAEIADLLDISVENVKVRCHRGRKKLIEAIKKEAINV
jgi:RNA polymerase sigma-70 factor (ECF subfamily)